MRDSFAHHLDAEDDVIAAALYYGGASSLTVAQLDESQLMRPSNQAILAALQEHASTGEVVDIATIVATLRRIGRLQEAGGAGGVADTSNRYTLTEKGVESAVERVRVNAKRRRLHQIAHRLAEHAQDEALDVDRLAAAAIPHLALTGASSRGETTLAAEAVAVYDALGEDEDTDVVAWPLPRLAQTVGPQRPGWVVVSGGWTSMGKALADTEPVLTPNGWRPMGDIVAGDRVIGRDGQAANVIAVHPQGKREAVRLRFTDGTTIVCDLDHLWSVTTDRDAHRGADPKTLTTAQIVESLREPSGRLRWRVPNAEPVDFPYRDLPLDPYVLGVLLGDGCTSNQVTFTTADQCIAKRVEQRLPEGASLARPKSAGGIGWSIRGISRQVEAAGLRCGAPDKRIPPQYLISGTDQRLELLRGLIDTDGTRQGRSIQFESVSPGLANDVRELAGSLGALTRMFYRDRSYRGADGAPVQCRRSYTVSINMPEGMQAAYVKRKRLVEWPSRRVRKIMFAEPVGKVSCTCITIDNDDRLFLARNYVPTHNSWFGLDCAECALDEGRRVLYVTLEMPAREVAERMVARGGVDLGALQGGGVNRATGQRMSDADYQLALRRSTELSQSKGQRMTILDGSTDARQVIGRLAAAEAAGDPYRYVVIDTLNLLGLPKANSRREGIDEALKLLKHGAVRHGVTIHVQAQLGRSDDKRQRAPRLQDYKESGGIEQIADVALFVHREATEAGEWTDEGAVILAKARSGARLGRIRTRWDGATYRYVQAVPAHGFGGAA